MPHGQLPTGTVTFLFTDIEGSTKLWEAQPEAMRLALERHDEIAATVIGEFAGFLIKSRGEGDSLFAVFPLATNALAAAAALQRTFMREDWPGSLSLCVRMALHTGEAGERDGDYYGAAVNRSARLRAIGHGGQILISDVTHDLCRPEGVFQFLHKDLPADFRPLRSLDNPDLRHNLPQQVTSFVGREKESAEVGRLLAKTRLLTLTGSGGCGKTRLALQVAADMLDGSGDGVWLVELASLSDPGMVPQALATVLGVKEEPGESITQTLVGFLRGKYLLLVLDNCEHLLAALAQLVDAIIRQCPRVLIIATSREGLGIAGELSYRVPSLTSPDPNGDATPAFLSQYEAVRLFIERAQLYSPSFSVTNENAPALASICHRLDGIPLAIELAAARSRSLSVEEIEGKLDQRFRLLTGGSRTALPRQQTLRSLIDWSYDLLNDSEKALLCRLAVFSGGCTLEAAEDVCLGDAVQLADTLDLLTSLVDKSLVVADQSGGHTRYKLLETVRQYARDRLLESGSADECRSRHLAHFLALAELAMSHLTSPEAGAWLKRLEDELDNLRAACDWSCECARTTCSARLATAMFMFWRIRGHYAEGMDRMQRVLNLGIGQSERASLLNGAGILLAEQGSYDAARERHEEALALQTELSDRVGVANTLTNLGGIAAYRGETQAARSYYERSLSIARDVDDRSLIAESLLRIGAMGFLDGEYVDALLYLDESLELARALGVPSLVAGAVRHIGFIRTELGDLSAARSLHTESLDISRILGAKRSTAWSLLGLGRVATEQGNSELARSHFEESTELFRELGDRRSIAWCLEDIGSLARIEQRPMVAAQLWGAAECLWERIGSSQSPHALPRHERHVAAARVAVGDEAVFDRAWKEGRDLPLDAAIELALTRPPT